MLLWSEHPGLLKSRKKCISPNPCTKTDKLLRLLEAAHRVDRRRLHEHDEDDEEDVGDRRRDASVRDVVPEACADTVDGVATAVAARRTLK